MKNILVPTDFSTNAYNALFYATRIYKDVPCRFYLLHAYRIETHQFTGLKTDLSTTPWGKLARQEAVHELMALKQTIRRDCEDFDHTFDIVPIFGDLLHAISKTIILREIDLIVMGTQGATGAKELFFGSNTVDVMGGIRECPVLALPAKMYPNNLLKIAFPSDLSQAFNAEEIAPLIELADIHKSEVHVLHVTNDPEIDREKLQNFGRIKSLLKNTRLILHSLPANHGKAKAISDFIEREKISLLVMVNTKNNLYYRLLKEPVIKRMGYHSNVPFLTIPEN